MNFKHVVAILLASPFGLGAAPSEAPPPAPPESANAGCQAPAVPTAPSGPGQGEPSAAPCQPQSATATPGAAAPYYVIGNADAPVSMVEFSDLQCPYCARYSLQTFPQIKRAYIDTGKVRYAVIDFPLPMHPQAVEAAVAARCAGEQGKFWEYRELVFKEQMLLASSPYDSMAKQLGLDPARFDSCRRDWNQQEGVQESLRAARQSNIGSTPSFIVGRIVDGRDQTEIIEGAKSYDVFAAKIDALLSGGQ